MKNQSEKMPEIVVMPEKFENFKKVEVRTILVKDVIEAQRVSEMTSGRKYESALVAQIATFDGKKLLMEDIMNLPDTFFFNIYDKATGGTLTALVEHLLSSVSTQDSDLKVS